MNHLNRVLVSGLALGALGAAIAATPASATTTTVVTTSGQAGWKVLRQCFDPVSGAPLPGDPSDTVTFVKGPASPPGPTGSLQLAAGNGTTGGDCESALRNTDYSRTRLSSLTALTYATCMSANNGQQFPVLSLNVDYSGSGKTVDDTIFFEPPYQNPTDGSSACPNQGVTLMNTWQTWNALTGCWWSNSGDFGNPGSGVLPLTALLNAHPNATIINQGANGGVRLFVGEASPTDVFVGNADLFHIAFGTRAATYNFEAAAVKGGR